MTAVVGQVRARIIGLFCIAFFGVAGQNMCLAQMLVQFNFSRPADREGWQAVHDVAPLEATPEGLLIKITGPDPYIAGPAHDYPASQPLWLRMRLKSDQEGMAQLFYFDKTATEGASVRVPVRAGVWEDIRIPFPPMGPGYRLRFDPPGGQGQVILNSIAFARRQVLQPPAWPKPQPTTMKADSPAVRSGDLLLTHAADELGGFKVTAGGQDVAIGYNRPMIGYVSGNTTRWLDLRQQAKVNVSRQQEAVLAVADVADPDGGTWHIAHRFSPGAAPGVIDVEAQVTVDKDRAVAFLPMLMLLPGVGSFGTSKTAALFPGLEYLDKDEPSSSEADIVGPGSQRQVPDSLKITFPLMTVLANGRYVGLIWRQEPDFAALFDSPDRIFQSGGHAMGLIFPGSDGNVRQDGSVLPYAPEILTAGKPLTLHATIIAGSATNLATPIQQYVRLRGLPPVPDPGMDIQGYVTLAAAGWLDSKIREGSRFRHAWPGQFQPSPAADAAMYMDWLASRTADKALAQRLTDTVKAALAEVPPAAWNSLAVSHVRYPVESLLYGHVAENVATAKQHGTALLGRFQPDGTVLYKPGQVDYGKTHFAKDANGLSAQLVWTVLEAGVASGDQKLIAEGLRVLKALDKFAGTAPRGAQTWECPLHTPDILASAHLVHAYTLGYQITGDPHFLDMARYWAWTGIPFTYLVNPTTNPIGPYATIAVFGATNWVAPNWMGMPVQWCGLVYADELNRLALVDSSGPWRQLADGIAASGVQQTFPIKGYPERQGTLPDSYMPRVMRRNDPGINPGTVQATAIRLYKQPSLYTFHAFRTAGLFVHAPGDIADAREEGGTTSFKVQGCFKPAYNVLVSGCRKPLRVRINGADAPADAVEFSADTGLLVLHLKGDSLVELVTR